MSASPIVISIGATCFGIATGYVTHRTLLRRGGAAQLSDLAAVLAAVGGAVVTARFPMNGTTDSFGWYSIGLLVGMVGYFVNFRLHTGRRRTGEILAEAAPPRRPNTR